MKKWKLTAGAVFVLAVIVALLFYNKHRMAKATPKGIQDVYYVSVENAAKKELSESLSLVGVITANNDVNVISETQGKVTAVFAQVGDYKTAGSVLVQVDDELKKAALMSAEANYEKAKKDYERFQELYKQKSASDSQLDQAKLGAAIAESQYIIAKRQYEDTKIKTPISGVVTSRLVDVGSMVMGAPQATLVANVVDISKLKVKLNVAESDVFKLKVGDQVSVTTDVYPGVTFKGRIETISSKADDAHTYPIEVTVMNNKANPLKAGMFARVSFSNLDDRSGIVIPREALTGSVKNPQVFVVENGVAKLRDLVLGGEAGTSVQVLRGLMEGETIVVSGQNNLVDGVSVQIVK
jgi:RND family efflux transporter MFP subunit